MSGKKPDEDGNHGEDEDLYFDPEWSRKVNSYGTFRRGKETRKVDKQIEERGFAEDALVGGGFTFASLDSCDADPPDCVAMVDGRFTGIEVVELVDEKKLKRLIEACSPRDRLNYRQWTRGDFLARLRELIEKKSKGQWTGGPYERRMLVVHTDEMTLTREGVEEALEGQHFATGIFSDVVLVLSYDPNIQGHPAFRLTLDPT